MAPFKPMAGKRALQHRRRRLQRHVIAAGPCPGGGAIPVGDPGNGYAAGVIRGREGEMIESLKFWETYIRLWDEYQWLAILMALFTLVIIWLFFFLKKTKIDKKVNNQYPYIQRCCRPNRPTCKLHNYSSDEEVTDNTTPNPGSSITHFR